ncbi:MAG TPA: Ku protein [Gemmatimonadaceae bacterium]|nr:Ku protein [Gemmatimonadaceae bacterium]
MPDLDDTVDFEQLARGRPIWTGTVSFGLVSVPVNIMPANRPSPIAFHMVDADGEQLKRRYFGETGGRRTQKKARGGTQNSDRSAHHASGRALTRDDIVRGYEWKKGKFVVLDDDELERIAPESTRDIDLRVFVDVAEIDPLYFVRAYYLTPVGSPKAYKLLATVMEERARAGVATFVMRAKEYVAAILAENGILRLETLRFANEIRSARDIGLPAPVRTRPADVKKMASLIKRHTKASVDKRLFEDRSAEKIEELARRKAKQGDDVVAVPVAEDDDEQPTADVIDLMSRLQQSLSGGRGRKRARARA